MKFQKLEEEIVYWINTVRTNPISFINVLESYLSRTSKDGKYSDPETNLKYNLHEGTSALTEAINYLKTSGPLSPLSLSAGLKICAGEHAEDLGKSGRVGHSGSNGSGLQQRVETVGNWRKSIAENISVYDFSAINVIASFIVDDGNPTRSQRRNLFLPK